jgi:hypothetical protein
LSLPATLVPTKPSVPHPCGFNVAPGSPAAAAIGKDSLREVPARFRYA